MLSITGNQKSTNSMKGSFCLRIGLEIRQLIQFSYVSDRDGLNKRR